MAAPRIQPKKYDDAILQNMTEPLTVRIESIRGAQRTPVNLPPPEDPEAPQNGGLTREDIRGLESFLSTQWTGGGFYEITVTDSTQPTPQKMSWTPYFDPQLFPPRKPPTPEEYAAGVAPIVQLPVSHQVRGPMSAFPNGFPNYGHPLTQQGAPSAYTPYPALPPAPPVGTQQWATYSAELDKRRHEDELARLRAENEKREREAQEARHKAEMERERQATEARFRTFEAGLSGLQNNFTSFMSKIESMLVGTRPNPELEALKAQQAASAAQLERERQEREAERREQRILDTIKSINEAMQRQIDTLTRQFDDRTRALTEQLRAPDAMLALMKENAREHNETVKELSRNAQAQMTQLQAQMMRPTDVLQLAQTASQTADANTQKIASAYGDVLSMHKQVIESAMQMQPQGSGVIDVVRDGIGGLKDFAERYVGAKSAEGRMVAQAQVEIAQAQAYAAAAAAQAANGTTEQPTTTPQLGEGQSQRSVGLKKPTKIKFESPPQAPQDDGKKRLGHTDMEWFGRVAYDEVMGLRANVDGFIESLRHDPPQMQPDGRHIGAKPEQVVQAVLMATQMAMQQNVHVKAIIDLLMQQRYADFVDVLIPNAPPEYKVDVVQLLAAQIAKLNGQPLPDLSAQADEGGDEDDDEDEGDDDETGDDSDKQHDGKIVAAAPAAPTNGVKPAPAVIPIKGNKPNPSRRA